MLEALGVPPDEERCYEVLLRHPHAPAADLARHLRVTAPAAKRCVDALIRHGLARRDRGGFVATRPDIAIEVLVLSRRQDLERVRAAADTYLERFRAALPAGERAQPVDVVIGPNDAILRRWEEVQRRAVREVLILDRPPYVRAPGSANPVELELLARGVQYRVIYDETSLMVPGRLDAVRASIEAGEQGRVLAGLPMKLIVADGTMALTHDARATRIHDSVVINPCGLLDGLVALFETLWHRAVPLTPGAAGSLDEKDHEILALLVAGCKDETVARQLGLGLRTVRRRIAGVMAALGARTRLQAGAEAVRRELV